MTADELKDWLGQEESAGAGWSKDDGSGETIGHERYVKQSPVRSASSEHLQRTEDHRNLGEESQERSIQVR